MLDRLRGKLVVSCQPVAGGPLDRPDIVAAFALAALAGGAAGLRIEGAANVRAVRARALGADAVVVGSAITRPEHVTAWFVRALEAGTLEAAHA